MAQSHTIFFKDKNHCAVMFLAVAALHGQAVNAAPIQFAGQNSELVISEVSERTAGIELLPLDEQGHPRQAAPSTILASFPMIEKLRARELNGEKEFARESFR